MISVAVWQLQGVLQVEVPLPVGRGADHNGSYIPLAVSSAGNYYIPGRFLTWTLHNWFRRISPFFPEQLWSCYNEQGECVPLITVDDAPILLDPTSALVVELPRTASLRGHGHRIAPVSSCRHAILPKGTRIYFCANFEVRDPQMEGHLRAMLRVLIPAWQSGLVSFGSWAAPARQAIRLSEWSVTRKSWASRQDILQLLRAGTGTAIAQDKLAANQEITLKEGRLIVAIDLRTASPQYLSGDNGTQARCNPHNGKQVHRAICVPGGTMKVYLRRRTERFLRCVLGSGRDERREPLDPPRPQRLRQDAMGLHLLFGEHSGPDSQGDSPIAQCALPSGTKAQAATNGRGALDVHDLVGCRLLAQNDVPTCRIGHSHNGKRNGNGEVVIRQMGEEEFQLPDRDAFCSQSSPRELVDVPAQPIVWSPLILELDLGKVSERRSRPAACGLFLAMLGEVARRGIQLKAGPFGGGEKLEIERVRFEAQRLDGSLALLDGVTLNQGDLGNLPPEVQQCLVPVWIAWLRCLAA